LNIKKAAFERFYLQQHNKKGVTRIFKFGGASVKDAAGIRNVAQIIQKEGGENNLVVVVSALGKSTNALEKILNLAYKGLDFSEPLEDLKQIHKEIATDLFGSDSTESVDALDRYFLRLYFQLSKCSTMAFDMAYDQVVSFGEYLSTLLVYQYLRKKEIPVSYQNARFLIKTDLTWREGGVHLEETAKHIQKELEPILKSQLVLTQGFIGGTKNGFLTTLGREGSDYTAAILGYCLEAESVTIWKDVPGVLNADPKWIQGAELISELSYQDATELTYYGATVIHPKTIRPLAQKGIPLYVRSFTEPEKPGTRVGFEGKRWQEPAFIRKENQTLVSFTSKDYSFMDEKNITEVLHLISKLNLKTHLLQVSATSISVVTEIGQENLEILISHSRNHYSVLYNQDLTLITIKNYNSWAIDFVVGNKAVILEQRSRHTCQLLIRAN
jgi:aspartate kinase